MPPRNSQVQAKYVNVSRKNLEVQKRTHQAQTAPNTTAFANLRAKRFAELTKNSLSIVQDDRGEVIILISLPLVMNAFRDRSIISCDPSPNMEIDIPSGAVVTRLSSMSVFQIKATLRFVAKVTTYRFSARVFTHALLMNQELDQYHKFNPNTQAHRQLGVEYYHMAWIARRCITYLATNDLRGRLLALLKFWVDEPRGPHSRVQG